MSQIDVKAAAEDLPGLIARACAGEEVVLVESGREVVKLVPVALPAEPPARKLGLARGKWDLPDDFDAPLPENVLALFYEGPLFPPQAPAGARE
jgi:antitoxin (DNA-binding transcriptional repressor) of toxin-antitoxin stability system